MKEEKYYCDKCKKEVSNNQDTCLKVVIKIKYPEKYYASNYWSEKEKEFLLCYDCCKIIGIKPINKEMEKKQEVPDIKEKLYEILCDLGVKFDD